MGPRCSSAETQVCHRSYIIAANLYPNVHVILKLLLTLPVGSCACDRSFSALRRLGASRATMTKDRLCGLTMFHVHRNDIVV